MSGAQARRTVYQCQPMFFRQTLWIGNQRRGPFIAELQDLAAWCRCLRSSIGVGRAALDAMHQKEVKCVF